MTPLVYASSLESVTRIASNPPLHLDSAIEGPYLSLVLYIARVPGSRDVFLTPVKPRDRIVTAEDVQSSLYYIHINSPEDFEASPPPLPSRPSSVDASATYLLPKPRENVIGKPLLPRRPAASNVQPCPAKRAEADTPARLPRYPKAKAIARKPISSVQTQNASDENRRPDLPRLPPRPLPTPPNEDAFDETSLHQENVHLLRYANHTETPNPYEQVYPAGLDSWVDPVARPPPGSLTLIRRDPSTHEQWNVASIHDPPVHEMSSSALLTSSLGRQTKKEGAPLYLDITNPSYAQFLHHERADTRDSNRFNSLDINSASARIYRQRLYMPGSRLSQLNHGITHTRFGSNGSNEDILSTRLAMRDDVDFTTSSPTVPDRRSKGYIFHSPWGSPCEFHTGTTGRSLKCRHFLPGDGGHHVDISELRFNLPTTAPARKPGHAVAGSEKRGSYLQGLHRRLQSTQSGPESDGEHDWTPSMVLDEDGRIDLTLGREKAGGGFGGRQAKLGKLIVEPEGLKMLDLLVAANIGLWWRAYEKYCES